MKPVVLIGGGGHAKVVIDALQSLGMEIIGIADPDLTPSGTGPFGVKVLGNDDEISKLSPNDVLLANGVGSIGSMDRRDGIYRKFAGIGFSFVTVVHPGAVVSPRAQLGNGCQIMAGAIVQCDARLGPNCLVNTNASVDHDCVLGRSVHVAPGAVLCGNVTVGDCCHVGSGAILVQGVKIDSGTMIAAGKLVSRRFQNSDAGQQA